MTFTSLLPPPINSNRKKATNTSIARKNQESLINAFVNGGNVVRDEAQLDSIVAQKLSFHDIIPLRQRDFNLAVPAPSNEEIEAAYRRTKNFFDKILLSHLQPHSSAIKNLRQVNDTAHELPYGTVQSSGASETRILTIVDQAKDPLQPNTVKATKLVAPPSDEEINPIYHKTDSLESTKKLSKEERDMWNIPAAISSWKNPKGYTIALEKRLSMDARYNSKHLEGHEISDGFSKLSTALEAADRKARQEIKLRAEAKRRLAEEETIKKEERLMNLAQKAREERERHRRAHRRISSRASDNSNEDQREVIRLKRRQELEEDIKKSKMSTADRLRELAYSQGRDISEKVVLSVAKATESKEIHYDSRLFSKGANAQARRNEEQLYDRPLFATQDSNSGYRANIEQISRNAKAANTEKNTWDSEPVQFTDGKDNLAEKKEEN